MVNKKWNKMARRNNTDDDDVNDKCEKDFSIDMMLEHVLAEGKKLNYNV